MLEIIFIIGLGQTDCMMKQYGGLVFFGRRPDNGGERFLKGDYAARFVIFQRGEIGVNRGQGLAFA